MRVVSVNFLVFPLDNLRVCARVGILLSCVVVCTSSRASPHIGVLHLRKFTLNIKMQLQSV